MTPVIIFLFFLSLTVVPPGATDQRDASSSVSDVIAEANDQNQHLTYGDIMPNHKKNADICVFRGCKWPRSGRYVKVPVSISSSYSRAQKNIIIRALLTFHRTTCIRFYWRRFWHRSYIRFYPGNGCWSYLGRQGGRQAISLKKNGCLYEDTVQHEVLHALGFHHEHVRSDRDNYVRILTQNIRPGVEDNFKKTWTYNLGTPYDFNSVMHYSKYAFSKNGLPTIVSKSNANANFGYATTMSANDISRVNRLYC